ncbi:hypothetical protein [Chelativorans sp. Marseille-P2723]|uniref:hypothetical protein n=1 Tax=Chelativorans sp. Marseille-P2723 TaxID=2709133 RepID=UPI0015702C57|nr:hypothetical protein [Chelativorans sp. Marseille-P2723]
MKRSITLPKGVAYPDDLAVLERVFQHLCEEHDISSSSAEAEDLAQAMMSLFMAGVDDEGEMVESLRIYLQRSSRFERRK